MWSAVLAYSACSAGMTLLNKAAIEQLPLVGTLVALQMLGSVVLVLGAWKSIVLVGWRDTLRWLPVPITFVLMLGTSLQAYQWNTVSSIVIVRNLSPFLALGVERVTQRVPPLVDGATVGALVLIFGGVALYRWTDVDITTKGAWMIVANLALAVTNRCWERWLMATYEIGLSTTGMVLYNNVFGTLLMVPWLLWRREPEAWPSAVPTEAWGWAIVAASVVGGFGISFTGLNLQRQISATSFMVLTNVNKVLVLAIEWWFVGKTYTTGAAIGSTVAMVGGALYGVARHRLEARARMEEEEEAVRELLDLGA
jgi:drug/metabolite transporter (DMT)-like permease